MLIGFEYEYEYEHECLGGGPGLGGRSEQPSLSPGGRVHIRDRL